MSESPPEPPTETSSAVVEGLQNLDSDELRQIAEYAESLASYRESTAGAEENDGDDKASDSERPDDVPSNASVTVKTINGNRYRYWQWRDGDKIKSRYIGPVASEE